jgi:hypothetical protein
VSFAYRVHRKKLLDFDDSYAAINDRSDKPHLLKTGILDIPTSARSVSLPARATNNPPDVCASARMSRYTGAILPISRRDVVQQLGTLNN